MAGLSCSTAPKLRTAARKCTLEADIVVKVGRIWANSVAPGWRDEANLATAFPKPPGPRTSVVPGKSFVSRICGDFEISNVIDSPFLPTMCLAAHASRAACRHNFLSGIGEDTLCEPWMMRRIMGRWPLQHEAWPGLAKRAARRGATLCQDARVPIWDKALASVWTGAGRLAPTEGSVMKWRSAWRRRAERRRLGRGHR